MNRKTLMCLITVLMCSCAFAWHGGNRGSYNGGNYNNRGSYGSYRGGHFRYYDGRFYSPFWTFGTFLPYLPYDYTIVVVGDDTYYYYDGTYFRPYSDGFIVVQEPTEVTQPEEPKTPVQQKSSDTMSINVPTSKGDFCAVKLVKHKNGYIGPQGEYYDGHPTVDQLKVLYGK
jgi:hypothetical protein